jgi:multisubunit Na+/H+ antiporter MnhC subunit
MVHSIDLTSLMLALVVGCLMATGSYLILRRGQIRLILGLGLFSHAINLLLFGTGPLTRGRPPVIADKYDYLGSVQQMADPLPQALILTAIVISFGMTAFIVVLVSRRDALTGGDVLPGEMAPFLNTQDPFAHAELVAQHLVESADEDYDVLHYELDEVYDQSAVSLPFHENESSLDDQEME